MNDFEDLLQERLERLEAGEPLADCLAGVPPEVAELLELAADLQAVAVPALDNETAVAQRASLVRLGIAQHQAVRQTPETARRILSGSVLRWWRAHPKARWAASALTAVVVVLLVVGVINLTTPDATEVAQVSPPDIDDLRGIEPEDPALAPIWDVVGNENDAEHEVFIPSVSSPLQANAQTAVLDDIQGVVEVQNEAGGWTAVSKAQPLVAGHRVRTGKMSQATLSFYDGSRAFLGPDSELSVDILDAQRPEDGFRTVVMTQWAGASEHDVQFRNDSDSRYEVNAPSGSGVARGTKFQVVVTADQFARYIVIEGRVDVTNINVTVSVVAGQMSTILFDEAPSPPFFRVTGEGEVTEMGQTWTIGGQTFATDDTTIIVGNPQIGDLVLVEGHLLPDGSRVADTIRLLRRDYAQRFTLTGEVEAITDESWTIAGQTIVVDADSVIDAAIETGDMVRVTGLIQPDGILIARQISLIDDAPGLPFQFVGVVQEVADAAWIISGQTIAIDENTRIFAHVNDDAITAGDVVMVSGWILEDGTWLGSEIALVEEDSAEFSFAGSVQSIDPWLVAGIAFETRAWTAVTAGIAVGDLVRVEGLILDDGTWVASRIDPLDPDLTDTILFVGTVDSIDPWIVNGILLVVDEDTAVIGDIVVGSLVQVAIRLLPDGTWRVVRIELLDTDFGVGCFTVTSLVERITAKEIVVSNWPAIVLSDDIHLEGKIRPNSVISFQVCVQIDGDVIIVGDIIFIYQIIIVAPAPPPGGDDGVDGGGRATLCHNGHTIMVSESAVQSHLRNHDDYLGPCHDGGDDDDDD